jgi:hypothetical protein
MNQHAVVGKFSHVKPGDTEFEGGGLRDFFLYAISASQPRPAAR